MKSSTLEIKKNAISGISIGFDITKDSVSESEDVIKATQKEMEIKKTKNKHIHKVSMSFETTLNGKICK